MIVLVYDVSNKDSFGHIKFWYEKAKESFLYDKEIIGCVIGNKSDLTSIVSQSNAKQLAESLNMKAFECSAVRLSISFKFNLNFVFRKKIMEFWILLNILLLNM